MYIYPNTFPQPVQHYIDTLRSMLRQQRQSYTVLFDGVATPADDPGVYLIPLHIALAPPQRTTQYLDVYLACQFDDTGCDTDYDCNNRDTALPSKMAYQAIQYSEKYPAAPVASIALDGADVQPHEVAALIIEHAQQICE